MQGRDTRLPGVPGTAACAYCTADGTAPGEATESGVWSPERLAHLVYVDALVPTNGERARDLAPQAVAALEEQLGRDAWLWPRNAALSERYGPVLAKPFSEPVTATSPHAARLPRTYVAYAERDRTNPAYAAVAASAARVAEWGWPTIALPYDHNGHQSHPAEVAAVLSQLMAGAD